jgi:hypothetical protein
MPVNRLFPRSPVVNIFACDSGESLDDLPRAANDNCCPYCGGVLEPGDKASDCSGSGAWPMLPFPKGWGASC